MVSFAGANSHPQTTLGCRQQSLDRCGIRTRDHRPGPFHEPIHPAATCSFKLTAAAEPLLEHVRSARATAELNGAESQARVETTGRIVALNSEMQFLDSAPSEPHQRLGDELRSEALLLMNRIGN